MGKLIFTTLILIPYLALSQERLTQEELNIENLSFYNVDSAEVELSEFKGCYLYIDFWFKGCAPCIKQFPYSHELQLKLKNQPIKFINISFDQSYDQWLNAINEHNPTGINLWSGSEENRNLLTNKYGITFFPKYWLVDEKGTVINPSTVRPDMYLSNEYKSYDRLLEDLKALRKAR